MGSRGHALPPSARPRFADGRSAPVSGPPARYVSNRIFNDTNQNLFSENGVTQWGFVWGQFLDHTFGLRDEAGEPADMAFDAKDPLESFVNTLGHMPFARSAAAAGHRCHQPPAADQHRQLLHRRVGGVRRHAPTAWSGSARGRSTGRWATTGPSCSWRRTVCCRSGTAAATPARRRRWRSTVGCAGSPRSRGSPATCGPTRTSPCWPRTRCSRGSTTGSWACCRRR